MWQRQEVQEVLHAQGNYLTLGSLDFAACGEGEAGGAGVCIHHELAPPCFASRGRISSASVGPRMQLLPNLPSWHDANVWGADRVRCAVAPPRVKSPERRLSLRPSRKNCGRVGQQKPHDLDWRVGHYRLLYVTLLALVSCLPVILRPAQSVAQRLCSTCVVSTGSTEAQSSVF